MHFALLLLSLPLAFSLPYKAHTTTSFAPQVLEQITTLNTSLVSLTSAVNAFDGTLLHVLPQSLAVISAETSLDVATLKTTFIAKRSGNFSETESNSIVAGLAGLIVPIQTSLTALSTKVSYVTYKKMKATTDVSDSTKYSRKL